MNADRRRKLVPLSCDLWHIGQRSKATLQTVQIPVGLINTPVGGGVIPDFSKIASRRLKKPKFQRSVLPELCPLLRLERGKIH